MDITLLRTILDITLLITCLAVLLSIWRYHWEQRKVKIDDRLTESYSKSNTKDVIGKEHKAPPPKKIIIKKRNTLTAVVIGIALALSGNILSAQCSYSSKEIDLFTEEHKVVVETEEAAELPDATLYLSSGNVAGGNLLYFSIVVRTLNRNVHGTLDMGHSLSVRTNEGVVRLRYLLSSGGSPMANSGGIFSSGVLLEEEDIRKLSSGITHIRVSFSKKNYDFVLNDEKIFDRQWKCVKRGMLEIE